MARRTEDESKVRYEQGPHSDHETDHELSALHELLVDDLAGIVFDRLDVNGLLYDSICPAAQCLTGAVLRDIRCDQRQSDAPMVRVETWTPYAPGTVLSSGLTLG